MPIRVLHIFGGLNAGGAESRTIDIYRKINHDKVQYDFLVHAPGKGFFEDEVLSLGAKVYKFYMPTLKNTNRYKKDIDKFFDEHTEYDIVHCHYLTASFVVLKSAKEHGIKTRISHSRAEIKIDSLKNLIRVPLMRYGNKFSTDMFAVSDVAAKSLMGDKAYETGKAKVIPNAIEAKKYTFNNEKRIQMRNEFNIADDQFLVGHIGRLARMKNHSFLFDVFKSIKNKEKKAKLILIGDGELRDEIKNRIKAEGLKDSVIMTGVRRDVPDILQAIDVICFPSLYEGMPGVILESQAAGLPSVISDNITKEVMITPYVKMLSLNEGADKWADEVLDSYKNIKRKNNYEDFVKTGFDIDAVSKWYEDFYLSRS